VSLRYLLDTDTVSYALRGVGGVRERLLRQRPSEIAVSALAVAELRFGAERKKSKRLHRLIDAFCGGVTVLPFDEPAATRFGVVGAALAAKGRPIGQIDTLIAAQALAGSLTLVTHNLRHFSRVPGLRCVSWAGGK
jgi:tRNA(fMet)-specific endonuclease VapC